MAIVVINGTFISANLKKSEFEGKTTYSVQLDVYQEDSPSRDKMISIKVEDPERLQKFQADFKMGDRISASCSLTAYKNYSYFKLVDVLPLAKLAG